LDIVKDLMTSKDSTMDSRKKALQHKLSYVDLANPTAEDKIYHGSFYAKLSSTVNRIKQFQHMVYGPEGTF